ncbi:MAG: 3-deoxy-manno-octulosonate cytidylyltransferase [Alphaproteobacteria bacterium]|nr:MAG: 3-deoxy-manno-octulosonate cytidylyltransferase [Alphaproteobacteria bacterium]
MVAHPQPFHESAPMALQRASSAPPRLNPVIVIPARLAATRLPDKPLADIHGVPMIVHVWRRAVAAGIGPVVVACAEAEIAEAVTRAGGTAMLTRADHPSGSDRIFEAVERLDPERRFDVVVNLQGDLPTIAPGTVSAVLEPLADPAVDIATLAALITRPEERTDPNVVKAVAALGPGARIARALYFTRASAPSGDGPLYHHIGLYAYRRAALARFVALPPGRLETRERLEQLRALEAGMRIDVALVDTVPLGVDTPADLDRARSLLTPT